MLKWTRAVIRTLAQKIKIGTKFFIGHGDNTNQHGDREGVGTVLASFVKDIGGKVSNVIIGHFPNAESVKDMDAVSMEADIYADSDNIVGDITEVTGIALANSDVNNPAFPGALRLSSIQCFDTEKNKNLEKENIMGDHVITFQEVISFVKEHNVWPHQLFNVDSLKGDREFGKLFDSNTVLTETNTKLKKELDESKVTVTKLQSDAKEGVAGDRLKELFPKDLTDKQKQFITKRFKPDTLDDLSDDNIKKYIEEGRNDFAETAKLFGVADNKQSGTESTEKEKSDESGAGESSPETEALKLIGVE